MYKRVTKRYERNQNRPYKFEETREYHLAEEWFKERRQIKAPITEVCNKCFCNTETPIKMPCCSSDFCSACFSARSELYNRCDTCNAVIDFGKYDLYDSFDLTIPTYDDFYYEEEQKFEPIVLEPIEPVEEEYVGQLAEQDIVDSLVQQIIMLYLQTVFYASYSSSNLS